MDNLWLEYKSNSGYTKLFSEVIILDWYDAAVQAMCKLVNSESWFFGSIVYYDIANNERVFILIKLNNQLAIELKEMIMCLNSESIDRYENIKNIIEEEFKMYSANGYLFKANCIDSVNYSVVQLPRKNLKYFRDIEDMLLQDSSTLEKWINFFNKK